MTVLAAEGRVRLPFVLCTDGTGGDARTYTEPHLGTHTRVTLKNTKVMTEFPFRARVFICPATIFPSVHARQNQSRRRISRWASSEGLSV